jgi:hypothetical protein
MRERRARPKRVERVERFYGIIAIIAIIGIIAMGVMAGGSWGVMGLGPWALASGRMLQTVLAQQHGGHMGVICYSFFKNRIFLI